MGKTDSNKTTKNLPHFPTDVWGVIASFLKNPKDIGNFRRVAKAANNLYLKNQSLQKILIQIRRKNNLANYKFKNFFSQLTTEENIAALTQKNADPINVIKNILTQYLKNGSYSLSPSFFNAYRLYFDDIIDRIKSIDPKFENSLEIFNEAFQNLIAIANTNKISLVIILRDATSLDIENDKFWNNFDKCVLILDAFYANVLKVYLTQATSPVSKSTLAILKEKLDNLHNDIFSSTKTKKLLLNIKTDLRILQPCVKYVVEHHKNLMEANASRSFYMKLMLSLLFFGGLAFLGAGLLLAALATPVLGIVISFIALFIVGGFLTLTTPLVFGMMQADFRRMGHEHYTNKELAQSVFDTVKSIDTIIDEKLMGFNPPPKIKSSEMDGTAYKKPLSPLLNASDVQINSSLNTIRPSY